MALTHTKTTKITVTRPEGVYITQLVTTWKEEQVDDVTIITEEDQYLCLCGKVFTKGGDEPSHTIGFDIKKGWVCHE
jgi:hypothetical protein